MDYTELEKKIIKKGTSSFRKELEQASRPMLDVLRKYGVTHGHELLGKITLSYPYGSESFYQYAVRIPDDKDLVSLNSKILDNFMKDVESIKNKVEELGLLENMEE